MACVERNPNCGIGETGGSVPEPLPQIGSALGVIAAIISAVIGIASAADKIPAIVSALGGIGGGSAISGLFAVVAVIIVIAVFGLNRCTQGKGLRTCIAGAVSFIEESFSDAGQEIFPFTSQHTRVDVTVKSFFWNMLEQSSAFVFCSDASYPERSEIMRCYYYTERVCNAVTGSLVGAVVGGVGGIILGVVIGAAIGCAASGPFYALCLLLVLLIAAIVAAVAALIGAFIGGQIAKAASDNTQPTSDSGNPIAVGDLVTVNGNMEQRDYDNKANVMWWTSSTSFHGRLRDDTPQPFSYCDIDEQLLQDACPRAPDPIK